MRERTLSLPFIANSWFLPYFVPYGKEDRYIPASVVLPNPRAGISILPGPTASGMRRHRQTHIPCLPG